MAIQDRNLSVGTQLYAKYKGQTYTAEVIEKEGGTAYRLADGREFKSPSAAGTAITEKACNGWAFWSVGDGAENTGPVSSTKTRPAAKVRPAPKPQGKRRAKKPRRASRPRPTIRVATRRATTRPRPGRTPTSQ
jgi:Restriction Enzyme Adenine Methylase Associated